MLEWGTCPREARPPGPRLSSPREQERNAIMARRVGINILQFCLVSNSLSHTTLSIKWEVYFSKELCRSPLLCHRYDFACICVCIVGHGYATLSLFPHNQDRQVWSDILSVTPLLCLGNRVSSFVIFPVLSARGLLYLFRCLICILSYTSSSIILIICNLDPPLFQLPVIQFLHFSNNL